MNVTNNLIIFLNNIKEAICKLFSFLIYMIGMIFISFGFCIVCGFMSIIIMLSYICHLIDKFMLNNKNIIDC